MKKCSVTCFPVTRFNMNYDAFDVDINDFSRYIYV